MKVINLYNPGHVSFGPGCMDQMVKDYLAAGKKKIFILSIDPVIEKLKEQLSTLTNSGIRIRINTSVRSEPGTSILNEILADARNFMPDSVTGIGGGSVMDTAKLVAAFTYFHKPVSDYFGTGLLTERKIHLVCAPTTAGTGSEVSPVSILTDERDHFKKGIISPFLVADAAYIDPLLARGLPPDVTCYTGIDALTHCIEAYANKNAHPVTDAFALEGISLICRNLSKAAHDIYAIGPRTGLALGSLYGGMCLGPVNTAAVHALAYPLGSRYGIAHGVANALLLPCVMEFNLDAAVARYGAIARAAGIKDGKGGQKDLAKRGIGFIRSLIAECHLPARLQDIGIDFDDIEKMAVSAIEVKRLLKNNVRDITLKDAIGIYQCAF